MTETTPELIFRNPRAVVIAPAGCGKTELIVRAVSLSTVGTQLVLTHTHAGVASLERRFRKLAVPSHKYSLQTIASFALKYATAFPRTSSYAPAEEILDWPMIYRGSADAIKSEFGKRILSATYDGVFVDEFQDCTESQTQLIMSLAEVLPCRLLGDPLQGIFEFESDGLVNWEFVMNNFEKLPDLYRPHRWEKTNPGLGKWLIDIRETLLLGDQIKFKSLPSGVRVFSKSPENQIKSCYWSLREEGSVVAIQKWKYQAHLLAKRLNGFYSSIEEIESKDFFNTCLRLDAARGFERVLEFIDFVGKCITKAIPTLVTVKKKLEKHDLTLGRITKNVELVEVLFNLVRTDSFHEYYKVLDSMEQIPEVKIYRPELWNDMKNLFRACSINDTHTSLFPLAKKYKETNKNISRRYKRTVARVLLIKGLEYDNSIVLDADILSPKELYVALTRARKKMIIHTET